MTEEEEGPHTVGENHNLCASVNPEGGAGSAALLIPNSAKHPSIGFFPLQLTAVGEDGEAQWDVEITWAAGITLVHLSTGKEEVVTTFKGHTATYFWEAGRPPASISGGFITAEGGRVEMFLKEASAGATLTVKITKTCCPGVTVASTKICAEYSEVWEEPGKKKPPKPPGMITAGLPAVGIVRPEYQYQRRVHNE
jgi:hypothetical protein